MNNRIRVFDEVPKLGDVVVAIDFGTSRTAYSWLVSGNDDTHVEAEVMKGVGSDGPGGVKTMTTVLLKRNRSAKGGYEVVAFGHAAEEEYLDEDPREDLLLFKWFKMSLHKPFEEDPKIESVGGGTSLPVSLLIQKSLEFVSKEAMRNLKSKNILRSGDAHDAFWVLTVPAIWSDYGKGVMRKAAFEAGLIAHQQSSRLKLALEPECAAIAANRYNTSSSWKKGDKFMVADCGAGTLDITAFEVYGLNPFQLRQLAPPEGGSHGGKLVDDKFFGFLEVFLGKQNFGKMVRSGHMLLSVTRAWEEKKRLFVLDKDWFSLQLGTLVAELNDSSNDLASMVDRWNQMHPKLPVKKQGSANIRLSKALMSSFFHDVVYDIVHTTTRVIRKYTSELRNMNQLVIAGGFGKCPLLQERFKTMIEGNMGIPVSVGDHPDIMIVKGAAIFGVRSSKIIKSRKSKYTFGVDTLVELDRTNPDHDNVDRDKIVTVDGDEHIEVFHIHGKKGDDLEVDFKTPIMSYVPVRESQSQVGFDVLVTEMVGSFFLPDEEGVSVVASESLPVDMSRPFHERSFGVQFGFGDTEVVCYLFDQHKQAELGRIPLNFKFVA